ncbi:MAG: FAD-binding protein [Phycisphaerae bacterium]|nr:FAD-binding protein [Phycisphaerae bacterium]
MKTRQIANQTISVHSYNTLIVGAGAAGMNCAVHLYEFLSDRGIADAQDRIAVVTGGIALGASRMSGSDKQTYYKMGTSPETADSAEDFARSLTAAGCCHADLALAEGIGSLREFYHLVRAGVPFPHDAMGSFIGYKTDHDPFERATSAGPKTSKFMSECLQRQVERYGIGIFDCHDAAHLLTAGAGADKRIAGVVTLDKKRLTDSDYGLNVFCCENLVLAAGGPGELYETSVYPRGQVGIHGLALAAGLAAENLTESQFGLASTKFRWNVSGTYMQAIPRIFSTDADGKDERDFLTGFFPTMSRMATNIFLKGYQWPFDPQRISGLQSSLVDILVFNETQKGRRVYMDFLKNPVGSGAMRPFDAQDLDDEALTYLTRAGALQQTPIERLAHMNPPAIDIYKENGINLYSEPLEIAVCAQHNNGGFAVNRWWESTIPQTFVIGEMAGTHGVKRPGGSALNAGQTGGLRAAEYIANVYAADVPDSGRHDEAIGAQVAELIDTLDAMHNPKASSPKDVLSTIRRRMTASGGHIRQLDDAHAALADALALYRQLNEKGFSLKDAGDILSAIQAKHLALASVAFLKAIVELLFQGSGSRGSHLVLDADGVEIHTDVTDARSGKPLRFKPENEALRNVILQVAYDGKAADLFTCRNIEVRKSPSERKAFEPAWEDYRLGRIYEQ